jgi:hypothetical protein
MAVQKDNNQFTPMNKILCLLTFWVCSNPFVYAQYKNVTFDYERSSFNDGQPLPAESYFLVSGEVAPEVEMVEIRIFPASEKDAKSLYQGIWKRPEIKEGNTFQIPISYNLRSSSKYNFRVAYYKRIDSTSSQQFRNQLYAHLDAYVDQRVQVEKNRLRLTAPPRQIIHDLNAIVERSTLYYNNRSNIAFPGFSDMVTRGFENLKNKSLSPGKYNQNKGEGESKQVMKNEFADEQIGRLKEMIHGEVNAVLNTDLLTVTDSKDVKNYPTEKLRSSLTLNLGYGGVYFSGDINNLSYGSAPYAGVSFPLGNKAFASKFLSRTTLSAGVFIKNFSNPEGQTISGPVVGLPVYVGLGYPIVDFLRLNVGAAVLQNSTVAPSGINLQQVFVRPYVGLSVDINIWLGLGKNKL